MCLLTVFFTLQTTIIKHLAHCKTDQSQQVKELFSCIVVISMLSVSWPCPSDRKYYTQVDDELLRTDFEHFSRTKHMVTCNILCIFLVTIMHINKQTPNLNSKNAVTNYQNSTIFFFFLIIIKKHVLLCTHIWYK